MGVVYNTLKDKRSEVAILRKAFQLYPNDSSIASNIAEASCMCVCVYAHTFLRRQLIVDVHLLTWMGHSKVLPHFQSNYSCSRRIGDIESAIEFSRKAIEIGRYAFVLAGRWILQHVAWFGPTLFSVHHSVAWLSIEFKPDFMPFAFITYPLT